MKSAGRKRLCRQRALLVGCAAGLSFAVAWLPAVGPQAQEAPAPAGDVPQQVEPRLYVGRRVFLDFCSTCHGSDAGGSRLAPDLLARIERMSERAFADVLSDGYPGIENAPPPWGQVPEVGRYADELWDYLAARASGALGPGELLPARRPLAE